MMIKSFDSIWKLNIVPYSSVIIKYIIMYDDNAKLRENN